MKNLKQILILVAFLAVSLAFGLEAEAQESKFIKVTPDEVQWNPAPPFLPKGAQLAVIKGDPNEPGPFTIRLRFPPDYKIPAHKHPSFEHITVISGTLHMGMGEHLEHTNGTALPAGSFAYGPEEKYHFAWTTEDETVVQIQSQGPFGIQYFDPADDPRK